MDNLQNPLTTQNNDKPNPLVFPPTIIGHITNDISDLFSDRIENKDSIKIF